MKIKNKSAFSLVIAIGLVLIMTMLVLYILEYMIPYSKNVKWIENSSNAFYQAENSIEDWLYFFSTRWNWWVYKFADTNKPFTTWSGVSYKYDTTSSWKTIPYNWEWNSEFDTSFNTISQWNPIQLDIWKWLWINWWLTKIIFKVPDLDKEEGGTNNETLSWSETPKENSLAIINWQLSADNDTLNATWSWIKANDTEIFKWNTASPSWISMNWKKWVKLDWNEENFENFYSNNCWNWKKCSLKFSIINKLETTTWIIIPYLEYKIKTNNNIPLRYSRIKSKWKSYGFQKHLEIRIPQQTTNEAFDFTIFQ